MLGMRKVATELVPVSADYSNFEKEVEALRAYGAILDWKKRVVNLVLANYWSVLAIFSLFTWVLSWNPDSFEKFFILGKVFWVAFHM